MPIDARVITAYLNSDGNVDEISDPDRTFSWLNDPDSALPLSGTHYGWSLEPLIQRGVRRALSLPAAVRASSGSRGAGGGNSAQAAPTTLIKLDVGYWGAYNRAAEGGRDEMRTFGVIDGSDVWLCQFKGRGTYDNGTDAPAADTLLGQLLALIAEKGFGIRLISHAVAPATSYTQDLPEDRLTVIFPDLHLSEKWPDLPDASVLSGLPAAAQRTLLMRLSFCQQEPGGSDPENTSADDQAEIQRHLERLESGSPTYPLRYVSGTHMEDTGRERGQVARRVQDFATVEITKEQFLAAKAHVDREIFIRTCWFYPAGAHGEGDASPAVDLVNFLNVLLEFKNQGKNVKVYQVGDLYELWLGREFLYRGYGVAVRDASDRTGRMALGAMTGLFGDCQYRMDKDWTDDSGQSHPIKRYVFNRWPREELYRRHHVGSAGAPGGSAQRRLKALLAERIAAVKAFSLPMPPRHPKTGSLPSSLINARANQRTNAQGETEYLWNKMILDLFGQLEMINIWGNHDGYRGDPSLNGDLAAADKARAWISEPGLWIEHSHRWDNYNRDGMAFGAGVTNLVYYFFRTPASDRRPGIQTLDSAQAAVVTSQEHSAFVPGAAQWFLMRNFGGFSDIANGDDGTGSKPVHPFGIYVGGHTHSRDLVEIRFRPQLRVRARRAAEQAYESARDTVVSGAQRARREAGAMVDSLLRRIGIR